jgi:hypothetical protein
LGAYNISDFSSGQRIYAETLERGTSGLRRTSEAAHLGAPPCLYMLEPLHQSVELLRAAALCCKLLQPFAEHSIYGLMLGFGQQARLLD